MLTSLRLQNFRCFAALSLEAPAQGMILTGDNAHGKTSILEAICTLVRLHSPRTHRLPTMAKFGTPGFGIVGNPWDSERRVLLQPDNSLELHADGDLRPSRTAYLADGGLIVWIGNEDLELVRGPGEIRRHYLDFIGTQIDPAYRRAWSRYRRALRAKNVLLKESSPPIAEIISYEEILAEHGSYLMQTRARLIDALAPLAARAQSTISGKDETLALAYVPASGADLRTSMLQARTRELRLRQAVVGPHRDDLSLRIHGMPAAEFASEGQQRTLALALKLAQGELLAAEGRRAPIYLMDDIFGELDPARRNALMNHLPPGSQKWITTTHLDWLKDTPILEEFLKVRVENGAIRNW
ncbi:MAG: DNA replication and repair protein RecF [Verrucomicrobiota bacterium]